MGDGVRIVLRTGLFDHQLEKENDDTTGAVEGGCNITTRYLVISTYILYKIVDCKRYYF